MLASLALAFSAIPMAQATPVTATYTTSGSAGNWVYDFTITNNTGNQYLYFIGVNMPGATITKEPTDFTYTNNNAGYPFLGSSYNDIWESHTAITGIAPSVSLGGFELTSTAQTLQANINMFAFGYDNGTAYAGTDYQVGSSTNPGFSVAPQHASSNVPEPGSLALLGLGMLGLMSSARKTRRKS